MTETKSQKAIIRRLLFLFAALSLFTSLVINLAGGQPKVSDTVLAAGGTLGPIHIDEPNTILRVRVRQNLPLNHWSFVTLELLDDQKRYLTGFGDEFWSEDGYDSDGYYWRESEGTYKARVTVPKAGDYYLKVKPESNLSSGQKRTGNIAVSVKTASFSPIPHLAAGIIAIIAWFVLGFIGGGTSPLAALREH